MKKVLLIGALIASFSSANLYAATCTDTGTDGYNDSCDATMQLNLPTFAIIQFPAATGADGSDLSVLWDGTATGDSTASRNICIGTNSTANIDVTAASNNGFQVNDGGTTNVAYTLTLNLATPLDLSNSGAGGTVVLLNADADDLSCTNSDIELLLSFSNPTLATIPTDGTTSLTDVVTITVAPQ